MCEHFQVRSVAVVPRNGVCIQCVLLLAAFCECEPLYDRHGAIPRIAVLQGREIEEPIGSISVSDYKKSKKFCLFAKAIAHVDMGGQIHTQVMSGQESFKVKPFRDANCWAMIPEGVENIQKGEPISIFPLSQDRGINF